MNEDDYITLYRKDGSAYRIPRSFLDEKRKREQIAENKRQAKERTAESHQEIPDMRGIVKGSVLPRSYKETTNEYYNAISDYIEQNPTEISRLNPHDVKSVVDKSNKLVTIVRQKFNHPIRMENQCYLVSAGVAAILDKYGISYKVLVGAAGRGNLNDKVADKDKHLIGSNHVWISVNGVRYEQFVGQENNFPHYNITDSFKLIRRR